LSDYATKNKVTNDFEDFTTTWVNNNGQLADATDSANGSPLKSQSKRSSSVSTSSDSNPTTSVAAAALTPRRIDKGLSRIPAPIRSNTGLY
jgi:growth arrest-specific protein 2